MTDVRNNVNRGYRQLTTMTLAYTIVTIALDNTGFFPFEQEWYTSTQFL